MVPYIMTCCCPGHPIPVLQVAARGTGKGTHDTTLDGVPGCGGCSEDKYKRSPAQVDTLSRKGEGDQDDQGHCA